MNLPLRALFLSAALFQNGLAEPASPQKKDPTTSKPAAACPSCDAASSRLAAVLGKKACPPDCTKLCCTGKTAYFTVTKMADGPAAEKVTQALNAIEGTKIEKICVNTPCAVVKYDPGKTNPAKLAKAIDDAGSKVTSQKLTFQVSGMTCTGCSSKLTKVLNSTPGVTKVEKISHTTGTATLHIDPAKLTSAKVAAVIKSTGYQAIRK
jgi:copper chaperone CopZ